MTTITAMPRLLSVEEWLREAATHEGREELVGGLPIVPPTEIARNSRAAHRLARLLDRTYEPEWMALGPLGVVISRERARGTVREPDVVLLRGDADLDRHVYEGHEVALVAEMVSPSSVESDWVTKRAEYARAGVPRYLVVDLQGETPRMALFLLGEAGEYVEPAGRGDVVDVEIDGRVARITLADLQVP